MFAAGSDPSSSCQTRLALAQGSDSGSWVKITVEVQSGCVDRVGDGAGVAGDAGRVGVEFVEQQAQGSGDLGGGGGAWVSATIATFRIPASAAANRNSTHLPDMTTWSSPARSSCNTSGSGMPSSTCSTTCATPLSLPPNPLGSQLFSGADW